MIWQNSWAFGGLLCLVLPLLIHLLSRKRAVLQKFPSLRFLNVTRLLPTRSPNLSDIPLLLVRLAILAAAVLALAQPLWVSAARKESLNASLARVIVVDTSRSMHAPLQGGTTAVDSALALATTLAAEASTSVIVQTGMPSSALAGAAAWLSTQGGRGDVVVLSDFQVGAVDSVALASIPAHVGVRAIRLGSVPSSNSGIVLRTARTNVTVVVDSARTSAEWTPATSATSSIVLLAPPADRAKAEAAREAAIMVASPGVPDTAKRVAVVFPGAAEMPALVQSAKAPTATWMAQVMLHVRANTMLASTAADEAVQDTTVAPPFAVLARSLSGAPVVLVAEAAVNGSRSLLFVQRTNPSALSAAALIAAISTSIAVPSDASEHETAALRDDVLKQFERAPQLVSDGSLEIEHRATAQSGLSDGRWLWVLVLLLLGVETVMRRKAQQTAMLETT